MTPVQSWQASVVVVCVIAAVAMLVPVFVIDEPRYSRTAPSAAPLRDSVRTVLNNEFFRYYLAADFAYFFGLSIIQTGLLYYLTVLLELDGALTAPLLLLMVLVALFLYPAVNRVAKRRPGKPLVVAAFALAAFDFIGVMFLGRLPIPALAQAIALIVVFSVPFAILSVLPQWILSDIAEHAAQRSGDATAGMFFAARTFMQKIGQTVGVLVFALLTAFGRDVDDDLGIRLSGVAGVILYGLAAALFNRYDEAKLKQELI